METLGYRSLTGSRLLGQEGLDINFELSYLRRQPVSPCRKDVVEVDIPGSQVNNRGVEENEIITQLIEGVSDIRTPRTTNRLAGNHRSQIGERGTQTLPLQEVRHHGENVPEIREATKPHPCLDDTLKYLSLLESSNH